MQSTTTQTSKKRFFTIAGGCRSCLRKHEDNNLMRTDVEKEKVTIPLEFDVPSFFLFSSSRKEMSNKKCPVQITK